MLSKPNLAHRKLEAMADKRSRKISGNVAVRDLRKSMEFFRALGFDVN